MTDVLDIIQLGNNNQMGAAQLLLDVGESAMLFNQSISNSCWLGNNPALTPAYPNAVQLAPLGYLVITAVLQPIYGVPDVGAFVNIAKLPGGAAFFTPQLNATIIGPVAITGDVNAVITGGTVGISGGTVDATITGTPTVDATITGGTVAISSGNVTATISGTPVVDINTGTVTFTNADIDVLGIGGYVSPGQLANVYSLPAGGASAAAGATTSLGTWDVSTYASVIFGQALTGNSSTAAGAAVCSVWELTWKDAAGNVVASDVVSTVINGIGIWEIPARGAQLTVSLYNPGTVGTVSNSTTGAVFVDGSYRVIPNIRAYNNISATSILPVISGCTLLSQALPVGAVNGWVANIQESFPATALTYIGLLSLWAGEVTGSVWITPTALSSVPTIVDLTYAVQGSVIAGNTYAHGMIYEAADAAGTNPAQLTLNLPPTQCAVIIQTPATAGHFLLSLIGVPD